MVEMEETLWREKVKPYEHAIDLLEWAREQGVRQNNVSQEEDWQEEVNQEEGGEEESGKEEVSHG